MGANVISKELNDSVTDMLQAMFAQRRFDVFAQVIQDNLYIVIGEHDHHDVKYDPSTFAFLPWLQHHCVAGNETIDLFIEAEYEKRHLMNVEPNAADVAAGVHDEKDALQLFAKQKCAAIRSFAVDTRQPLDDMIMRDRVAGRISQEREIAYLAESMLRVQTLHDVLVHNDLRHISNFVMKQSVEDVGSVFRQAVFNAHAYANDSDATLDQRREEISSANALAVDVYTFSRMLRDDNSKIRIYYAGSFHAATMMKLLTFLAQRLDEPLENDIVWEQNADPHNADLTTNTVNDVMGEVMEAFGVAD